MIKQTLLVGKTFTEANPWSGSGGCSGGGDTLCVSLSSEGTLSQWKPGLEGGRAPLEGRKQSFFACQAIGGVGPVTMGH